MNKSFYFSKINKLNDLSSQEFNAQLLHLIIDFGKAVAKELSFFLTKICSSWIWFAPKCICLRSLTNNLEVNKISCNCSFDCFFSFKQEC